MRLSLFTLPLLVLALPAASAFACDGKADLEAAFTKQQQQPWHTVVASKAVNGTLQEQSFDYQPPDRMYRKVVSGAESVETIAIGRWAWSNIGSGWNELQPQFAQMATSFMRQTFTPPKVSTEFSCLGTKSVDGKDYAAYQTAPEKGEGDQQIARTIYIDTATGLPAFNIIGAPDGSGDPLTKEAFTYPTDIKIEKPL
jgi:hypothetical protein